MRLPISRPLSSVLASLAILLFLVILASLCGATAALAGQAAASGAPVASRTGCFAYETGNQWSDPVALDSPIVAVAGAENLLACATASTLVLLDVAEPRDPVQLGEVGLATATGVMALCDPYLVTGGETVSIYDLTDPTSPAPVVTDLDLLAPVRDIACGQHWLAIVTHDGTAHVFRRPAGGPPQLAWTVPAAGHVHGAAAWQDRLVLAGDELFVVAVPAADAPGVPTVERTVWPAPESVWGRAIDLAVAGDLALVSFEWWIPIEPGRDRGVPRDEPQPPMLLLGVDLGEDAEPGAQALSALELHQSPAAQVVAAGDILAAAGEALVAMDAAALADGPWLRPDLAWVADHDTRLAAAGDVLVRLDAGQARLLQASPLVAPAPVIPRPQTSPHVPQIGRWTTSRSRTSPGQTAYWQHLWHHGDPLAPTLVDSFHVQFSFEFGHGANLKAADGSLAVVVLWDDVSEEFVVLDASNPDAGRIPLPVESAALQLRGHRLVEGRAGELVCWDLSDPAAPQQRGSVATPGSYVGRIDFFGTHVLLWVTTQWVVVDVTDLDAPQVVATAPRYGRFAGEVGGNLLLGQDSGELQILAPDLEVIGTVWGTGTVAATATANAGDLVAVAWRGEGVDLVDVSDPTSPQRLHRTVPTGGEYVYDLAFGESLTEGQLLYLALSEPGMHVALLPPAGTGRILGTAGGYATAVTVTDVGVLTNAALLPLQCGVVTDTGPDVPLAHAAVRAAPNPFNPVTTLRFDISRAGPVTLDILDLRGHRIRRLVDAALPAGTHERRWDGADDRGRSVAAGVYLLRLETAAGAARGKLALVR